MTQLGLLHQDQTEAERGSRDPAVGSPRRPPTPPRARRAKGGGCYPRDAARASAARATRQREARARIRAGRLATQSLAARGERDTRAFGTQLLGSSWHGRRSIGAQPLLPTAAHTGTRARTRAQAPASPPGCEPSRCLQTPRPTGPATTRGAHPGACALPLPSVSAPGQAARARRAAPGGDGERRKKASYRVL